MVDYFELPIPQSREDFEQALRAMETMAAVSERWREEEKRRWASLTPDEKRTEREKPLLEMGLTKCPRCGALPYVRYSAAEGYEFFPVIFCFDDALMAQADANSRLERCANHGPARKCELMDMRFETFEELRAFWNGLIQ